MSPAVMMSPVTGLVLLLASSYVSSLVSPEYGADDSLPGHDTDEEWATHEKPGSCPADVDFPKCNPNITYTPECQKDKNCTGARKCCDSGCTKRCLLPLQEKVNPCPCFDNSKCIYMRPAPAECHSDSQCQGTDRCCFSNCRDQCTPTVQVKPGQCPAPKKGVTGKACTKDSDCLGTKKCCEQNGLKCVTPEKEHPGVCPTGLADLTCPYLNKKQCRRDSDCQPKEKCCLSGNTLQCQAVKSVKPGSCPIPLVRCMTPLPKPLCYSDKDCLGEMKCCSPWCRQQCTDPDPKTPVKKCPVVNTLVACKQPYPPALCGGDSDCVPGQMCCNVGCRMACTPV
ncbi:uncharacterized protein ACNLHF_013828 [Anomaloglossus baeobatrachus]|uniref:uncharacterized protein LOC142297099 n=1 Tax=Anomaloglossus baeobatrachus TaxID=238106 RepID=UPI003F50407C